MTQNKVILKIVVDFIVLACVSFPLLALSLWAEPYHRGYFEDDLSIRLPYKEQTISEAVCAAIGFAINVVTIIAIEVYRDKKGKGVGEKFLCGRVLPGWAWDAYVAIGVFTFGGACQQLTSNSAKYVIGRLRPHFYDVLHGEGTEDWTLQIKFVQKRDNGTYECQVSTRTGLVSHYVRLQIVVPEAFILGSGEHHVDLGSVIHLICIVEKSPVPPQYVFWYHNARMINYDALRGGITVETEPGARTQSRLTVRGATLKDSGNYTCSASNTEPASIHVFVSEGSNKMAAILRRNTSAIHGITSSVTCLLLLASVALHVLCR